MAFCSSCGKKIEEGVNFCSGCGKALSGSSNEPIAQVVPQQQSTVLQHQSAMADEKYCFSCGSVIKKAAEMCMKCGVNQSNRNSTPSIDVYCTSCGKIIKKEASVCPFCGVSHGVSQGFSFSGIGSKKGPAIASLVLGVNSLWAWFLPLVGFPVSILGLLMGIVGRKSSIKKMAMAGLILSIIGLVATIINSAIGAYQGATGF